LQKVRLQILTPQMEDLPFDEWWAKASGRVDGQVPKGLNSIIILEAWFIWKHRNHYVFDGILPNLPSVTAAINEDLQQWSLAGARGVSHLALVPLVA